MMKLYNQFYNNFIYYASHNQVLRIDMDINYKHTQLAVIVT